MHIITNRILSLILLLSLCSSRAYAESTPNVLFLAVDDMNDWIGCLETTPRCPSQKLHPPVISASQTHVELGVDRETGQESRRPRLRSTPGVPMV
jgi:hypothetical protein